MMPPTPKNGKNPHVDHPPPVILVSDYEHVPPVTMRYINGDNELELAAVLRRVSALSGHPGRGLLSCDDDDDDDDDDDENENENENENAVAEPVFQLVKECEDEYLEAFWNCASHLCDYFADFLASDTAVMQSVWFELLDELQDAAILPHQFWISGVPACSHAKEFTIYTEYFRELVKTLIAPRDVRIADPLMAPRSLMSGGMSGSPSGSLLIPGKSGLKLWQQFLYQDSPGFDRDVPRSKRVYMNAAPTDHHTDFDVHIPRGGLALLDNHTKRLRELTKKVYQQSDPNTNTNTLAEKLAEFDSHALDLHNVSTYTAIDGRQVLTKPMHPDVEYVRTSVGDFELVDPGFEESKPSLHLVNESIGFYKGKEPYSHPDDGDGKYQMLSVSVSVGVGSPSPPKEEEALQEAEANAEANAKVDCAAYAVLFDEWASSKWASKGGSKA